MSQDKHTEGTDLPSEHSDASTGSLRGARGSQARDELHDVLMDLALSDFTTPSRAYPRIDEAKAKIEAYAERLATERELETVRYWHKQTIHEVPHPIDIRLTLHAQEDRIRELEYMLAATLTGKAE